MEASDALQGVYDDCDEVYGYDEDARPQNRAHDYLERYMVERTARDTAMQRVCRDLIARAYEAGVSDTLAKADVAALGAELRSLGGEMLRRGIDLTAAAR